MITRLAVAGYRSLRDLVIGLDQFTLVTGPNGSGKSNLYRALRLLSETAQGRLIGSLAAEGGLSSVLWAGPDNYSQGMRSGETRVQGTLRKGGISMRLGFSSEAFGYAIDLGLPERMYPFQRDPEIKVEAMWTGELLGRSNLFAERRGLAVNLRNASDGSWRKSLSNLMAFDSMISHYADPDDGLELLVMRERMRNWRFYDNLRTDAEAPARRPQVMTFTPVLAGDGADLAAAVRTIMAIGDDISLAEAVDDAFPGARLNVTGEDYGVVEMDQPGLLRPLEAKELSDGTLRYLLLAAALLSPRPPEIMILNEPEASLHPSLLDALARLLKNASRATQIVIVSHSERLIEILRGNYGVHEIALGKAGETYVENQDPPDWIWPKR
ncbi:AAA family ATPase [Sphingosinicella rhizophila]|uniref:AAA family ATPase n=1 Tax=Sphingosinicella rhizophila TaxID=3050082 RepID=A0ABU3Q8U9_9SPHN|nr:AAA family ATPase [Sphingosinicella sp. GR2756]MDT9599827.1 AAA family ATPase [Sphingosinicella sp. GR2756]